MLGVRDACDGEAMSDGVKDLREKELVGLGPCAKCGKKLFDGAKGSMVSFYVVHVAQAITDPNATRRRVGLELQIGSLASFMGPDEPLAKQLPGTTFMLHQDCALENIGLMVMLENANEREKDAAE